MVSEGELSRRPSCMVNGMLRDNVTVSIHLTFVQGHAKCTVQANASGCRPHLLYVCIHLVRPEENRAGNVKE